MSADLVLPLQESLEELRRGHQSVTECLEQTLAECEERAIELAECRKQLAEAMRGLGQYERELDNAKQAHNDATSRCDALHEQLEGKDSQLTQLTERLLHAEAEVEAGTQRLELSSERHDQLKEQLARLAADNDLSRDELAQLRGQLSPLLESATEAATLRGELAAARAELTSAKNEIARLIEEIQRAQVSTTEADTRSATADAQREQLQLQLTKLFSEGEATRLELKELRSQCASLLEASSESNNLRAELKSIHGELSRLQSEPANNAEADALVDQLSAALAQNRQWQTHLERVATQADATQGQIGELRAELAPLVESQAEAAKLREELEAAHLELTRVRQQPVESAADADLRQQLAEADAQRGQLEDELDQLRHRGAELAEALAEQKRVAALEREQWSEELREMRRAVDRQAELLGLRPGNNVGQQMAVAAPTPGAAPQPSNGKNNRVLDSVLEQFEKLQKSKVRKLGAAAG